MSDVKVCTEENSRQSGEIVICTEESIQQPSDIKVCPDDGRLDDCGQASPLLLSGSEDVAIGEIYTASGGAPPYIYNFSRGTIDDSGEILTVNACGTSGTSAVGVVSVSDTCNNTTSIEVRLPSGTWVIDSSRTQTFISCDALCPALSGFAGKRLSDCACTSQAGNPGTPDDFLGELIVGGEKVVEDISYYNDFSGTPTAADLCDCLGAITTTNAPTNGTPLVGAGEAIPETITCDPVAPYVCPGVTYRAIVQGREFYDWKCP